MGTEVCDDSDTDNSDGCSSTCAVESGWVCDGGSGSTADTCTFCTSGLYQDDSSTPRNCVPQCGDSLEAGDEKCDDGNTSSGDGCASDCSTVESNWVCIGGSNTTIDVCTECQSGYIQDDSANPEN